MAFWRFATSIIEQGFWPTEIINYMKPDAVLGPGLPYCIAILRSLFGDSWLVIFGVNAILGSLTVVLIFLLASRLFNPAVGLLSGFWACIYPLYVLYVPRAGKEIWAVFLFLMLIYCLIRFRDETKKWKWIILLAVFYTALIHFDERYLAYFVLLFIFIAVWEKPFLAGIKKSIGFSLLILLLSLPWLIRNYQAYGNLVFISVRTTPITEHFIDYGGVRFSNEFTNRSPDPEINQAVIDSILAGTKRSLDGNRPIREDQKEAIRRGKIPHSFTKPEKYGSILKMLWKPVDFWWDYSSTGFRWDGKWSLAHNITSGLSYGILLPFFLMGLFYLFRQNRPVFWLFLSVVLWHSLIHVLFIPYARNRYRLPIDFIIIILAWNSLLRIPFLQKFKAKISEYLPDTTP